MLAYTFRKLIQVPLLLFGVVLVMFVLIHVAPGDPMAVFIGDVPAPPEYVAELRHHLGLDRSLPEQFFAYLLGLVQGDLGYSFYYSQSVISLISERMPATFLLMATGLIAATLIGVLLGVIAAARPNGVFDTLASLSTLIGYSLPVFWLGELALLLFALQLGWFPTQGTTDLRASSDGLGGVLDRIHHLILPAAVLGTRYLAIDFRLTRAGVLEVLSQDYILTARAKGLSGRVLMLRHALRNALLPIVTITGLNVGFALSGAVLTEVVFGWPGIGRLTLDAIGHRDYPVLMGIFIAVTTAVVLVNFATDLVYAAVDPRIRFS
ncbi:MAG: ABC transporter permease [Chloroflexi bacterium]|nr:ABC transporter permease [Chloroflexota bacterium]